MCEKILIIDDEPEIADLIEVYLRNENYTVLKYYSPKEAMPVIEKGDIDLAILDIMLPDINGLSLCQRIRERDTYPIIMLTAKDNESDKITGLAFGADDYVTKPFRPLELIARVKAQIRRYKRYNIPKQDNAQEGILSYAGLSMNVKKHECHLNGEMLLLTPIEFEILRILLEKRGTVVSSEVLFHEIWKEEYFTKNNNTITVHVRHLREKMNDTAEKPKYIKTIWGVGYKIET